MLALPEFIYAALLSKDTLPVCTVSSSTSHCSQKVRVDLNYFLHITRSWGNKYKIQCIYIIMFSRLAIQYSSCTSWHSHLLNVNMCCLQPCKTLCQHGSKSNTSKGHKRLTPENITSLVIIRISINFFCNSAPTKFSQAMSAGNPAAEIPHFSLSDLEEVVRTSARKLTLLWRAM